MNLAAENLDALLDDLDRAVEELAAPYRGDPSLWTLGPPMKWTAGQQVEHVSRMLALGAEALEQGLGRLRRGEAMGRPWRDPLQGWFVRTVTADRFPRGGKAPKAGTPSASPDRERTVTALAQTATRYRDLVAGLAPEERRAVWTWNPFAPAWLRWHYTLPEMVRVQTTHARHHARLAAEGASAARGAAAGV